MAPCDVSIFGIAPSIETATFVSTVSTSLPPLALVNHLIFYHYAIMTERQGVS